MADIDLKALRKSLKITQEEMATRLGVSGRTYQDIEARKAPAYAPMHEMAIEQIAMVEAVLRGDPMLAPPRIRDLALRLAELIRGR